MRPDLAAGDLTLLQGGKYDVHWSLEVANGDGTLIQLYSRLESISGTLPSPDSPIGTLDATFLREPNDDGSNSLAPLLGASLLNRLDDGTTYSQLFEAGRLVVAKAAITARGASRPGSGFYEFFRGNIKRWDSPEEFGSAGISCVDQSGKLQRIKSEAEYSYAAGTAIETAIQAVLDNNGFSSITLNVPAATSAVLGVEYAPGKQKSVWEQVWGLAQSIGWVVWWRYQADGAADLTLFEPDRDKAVSDFTFPVVRKITELSVSDEDIFNVLYGEFSDADEKRTEAGPVEDETSIARYGGFRRVGWIIEDNDSPIRTSADMTTLLNAALSDLKDPDAIQSATVPLFLWGEVSADLYTFSDNDILFDSDQVVAPFAISFSHQIGSDHQSVIRTRSTPTAGAKTWRGRDGSGGTSEPERIFGIYNVEPSAKTDTSETISWVWGAAVQAIKVQETLVTQPVVAAQWPAVTDAYDALYTDSSTETEYTVSIPNPGQAVLVQFVPILSNGLVGIVRRYVVPPTLVEPDIINAITALVDDDDGSVAITVNVGDRTGSIRYDYNVGADPAWSTDGEVEAGTVATPTSGVVTINLAASTVPYNQMIRVRAAPYTGSDGTGDGGATDHGAIKGAEDIRLPPPVSLQTTTESESASTGTFGVTVRDPGGYALDLYYQTKSGTGAWGAWTLKTADPAHDTEYTQTVTLVEDHHSFIRFRLDYSIHGEDGFILAESGGFDRGKIPDIQIIPDYNAKLRTASCSLLGDFDTASFKVAASTSAFPSDATVRAATAIDGRVLTPAQVGTLISNLTPGQVVYIKAFGYSATSGGGNESSAAKTAQITVEAVPPILEKTTESESSSTGTSGVTVRDPSGLATGLDYRTKSGTGAWGSWTEKTATPANNTEYTETVSLIESHLSFIEWRLKYALLGQTHYFPLESAGFDRGKIPNVVCTLAITETGVVTAAFVGDFDTASIKWAVSTSGHPNSTTTRAATASNNRQVTTGTLATLTLGQTLYISWYGYSAVDGGGNEQTVIGAAQISRPAAFIPKVKESVSWSGSTATVTLSVEDTRLKVTAITWQTLTQGVSDGAASGTFDTTNTGTIGADAALVRAEAVTVAAGKDVSFLYVVTYTDENGNAKTIGGTIPLANLQSRTEIKRIPFSEFKPLDGGAANLNGADIRPTVTTQQRFGASAILPVGSTLTAARCWTYRAGVSDFASMVPQQIQDGTSSSANIDAATADEHGTTGWSELEVTVSEVVAADYTYTMLVILDANSSADDVRIGAGEFEFTLPSFAET